MHRKMLPFISLCAVLVAPLLMAQGRGGAGGQRGGQSGAGRQSGSQTRQGIATRSQVRQHIQATNQERDQLRTCIAIADRIQTQARAMARNGGKSFNAGTARQQRDRLRQQVQAMEQKHERLMQGLNADQKSALQDQIRNMDRDRERIHTHLAQMDRYLGEAQPNGKQVAEQARESERAMNEWRAQYQKMASEMGVQE
ncbi:MAG TPA: hypothetical protein VKV79_03855 [Terriglobia bacterium]|nr:hypothetical protein [Terriglobia bacterium]